MRKLTYSPCDYWFSSPLNPNKPPDEPSPAQMFGRAVHKLMLEGSQAFEGCYGVVDLDGRTKAGREEREAILASGREPLRRQDYDRIRAAGEMIAANEHLAEAFFGGAPEVSVFWTANGIRKKARLDYLKLRAIVDLKSIRNTRSIDFVTACRRAIAEWRYDIQCAHYREGRDAMRDLFAAGAVHGDHDREWLRAVVDNRVWAFVFCFWQAEMAPLTWATVLSPGNPILDIARQSLALAEDNYRSHMERFGPETPWLIAEPPTELDINHMPFWFGRAS
jgi:hypothetical protein